MLADLDRTGLVERRSDPADRRRTIVQIIPGQATVIGHWLDGAARPLTRVVDKLTPGEREAFLKAMDLLETELHRQLNRPRSLDSHPRPGEPPTRGMRTHRTGLEHPPPLVSPRRSSSPALAAGQAGARPDAAQSGGDARADGVLG